MACDSSFLQYVIEQLAGLGDVRYRRLFGEYCIYFRDVPVMLLCDDTAFVAINNMTAGLLGEDCETGYPYEGAKLHYVVDVDDKKSFCDAVRLAAEYRLSKNKNK